MAQTRKMTACAISVCVLAVLGLAAPGSAAPVVIAGVPGYGYNTLNAGMGYDGLPGAIGCGPTTGAMILSYYGVITDPLAAARAMGAPAYMDTNLMGGGTPLNFQHGLEQYALDQGYVVDATFHVSVLDNINDWYGQGYAPGEVVNDVDFWNVVGGTWTLDVNRFLDFLAVQIDLGRPVSVTVDSDGDGFTDHWMAGVGYDRETGQWAGYNTWDNTLHWYNATSAFVAGNYMGVGYVRTFEFLGPVNGGGNGQVPEPGTLLLMVSGLGGMMVFRFRRNRG